jgi:uncharacterized damage-inducible protein DinB
MYNGHSYIYGRNKQWNFQKEVISAIWGCEYHTRVNEYLNSLNETELNKLIEIPWANHFEKIIGRKPDNLTLEETMLQVTMHSQYHRGQVNARLRELGGEPPLIDFIVWVWEGKPGAVWEGINT